MNNSSRQDSVGISADFPAHRVIWMQCNEFRLESKADTFYAFFILHDRLMSVHRRFNLDLPDKALGADRYTSEIILTEYDDMNGVVLPGSEILLCQGEDPRVVSDGTRAYVVFRTGLYETGEACERYRLLILPERSSVPINLPAGMKVGKNWQPFLKDGHLQVIYGFDPVTLLEIGKDGSLSRMHQEKSQFGIPAPHDGYSMIRGGSNGVVENGVVYGLGHMTVNCHDHRPFFWTLNNKMHVNVILPGFFLGLKEKGFNIVDPTSLFLRNGLVYLGLAASERDWFFGQRFLNILIEFPVSAVSELISYSHSPVFSKFSFQEWIHLQNSSTYIPGNLLHQIPVDISLNGVRSHGDAGCLIHGPYEQVLSSGNFIAYLTYASSCEVSDEPVGWFNISFYRDGEIREEATCPLYGTGAGPVTSKLFFSTKNHIHSMLETRVFTSGAGQVEVFNIRVMQNENTDCDSEKE